MLQDEPQDLEAIERRRQERKAAREKPSSKQRGVMEDALDDAWEFAKGLYQIVPTTVRGWKEIATTDPEAFKQLITNPETPGYAKDMGLAVWSAIKEPYQKHGASVIVRRPVTFLSDAVTVLTLGGGSIAKAGRLAKAAGAGAKAEKVIAAGEALQKLPGKLARKAIDKSVLTATGGKYDLAKRREWLTLKREELGGASVRFAEDMEKVGKQILELNDKEAELFHKVRTMGDDAEFGVSIATLKANPKVAKAYGAYRKLAKQVWEENLKRRGVLDDAEAVSAIEKKFAAEAFGKVDDAAVAAARERLAKLKVKPTYGPSIHPAEAGKLSVLDNLFEASPSKEAGKVGFLEKFTGAQGAIKDPRIYVPKAIENYRKAEAKFRLSERTLESPHLTKNAQFAEAFDRERVPTGIFRKYFDDQIRAEAVDAITDPTIKRLLRQEFTYKANSAVKLYDAMMHLFRKSATRWNPRWFTGNVIGDAILGSLAGADWAEGFRNIKKGAMPQEVLAKVGMSSSGMFAAEGGVLERAVDIVNEIDRATRAGIITREVANRLKSAAIKFEGSAEVMEDVLRSTQRFSDLQVEMRLLREQVSRNSSVVKGLDKEIAALQRLQTKLLKRKQFDTGRFSKIDELRQKAALIDAKRDAILRDITDDLAKAGVLEKRIPGLTEQVQIARHAVDRANAFVGEYLGLSAFEQNVMRRVIPFYPWSKAMTMLAFRLPFLSPVKTFLWNRYSMLMWDQLGDKELEAKAPWTKGYVPVFARENGDTVWLPLTSYSPFAGLKTGKVAEIPVPGMFAFHESSPAFSLAIKFFTGRANEFDKGSVPYGEPLVNIANGDVWKFRADGMLERDIPQTPFISGLVHMFPLTQFVQDVITPYTVDKYDNVGFPQPKLKPDGTYMYPREWWQRLAAMGGVKLVSRSRESFIRSGNIKIRQAVKGLRKLYMRSNPEERETIREMMQDYARGEYRRIAQ